jgi:hypothetical protein
MSLRFRVPRGDFFYPSQAVVIDVWEFLVSSPSLSRLCFLVSYLWDISFLFVTGALDTDLVPSRSFLYNAFNPIAILLFFLFDTRRIAQERQERRKRSSSRLALLLQNNHLNITTTNPSRHHGRFGSRCKWKRHQWRWTVWLVSQDWCHPRSRCRLERSAFSFCATTRRTCCPWVANHTPLVHPLRNIEAGTEKEEEEGRQEGSRETTSSKIVSYPNRGSHHLGLLHQPRIAPRRGPSIRKPPEVPGLCWCARTRAVELLTA